MNQTKSGLNTTTKHKGDTMEIKFINTIDADIAKPVPASMVLPDWYKQMDSYINGKKFPVINEQDKLNFGTIKKCMPVFDALTAGYFLLSPADLYINKIENEYYYQWSGLDAIEFHSSDQLVNHPHNKYNTNAIPKWKNYWAIETPKGYSCLFISPLNQDLPFTIFPGIVDTDIYSSTVHFPFLLNEPNFEGCIKAGTPIAQVIPFKRDSWKMEFGGPKDIERHIRLRNTLSTKFFDRYKTLFWTKKEYR